MAGNQQLRVDKAVERLAVTDGSQRYERLKRDHYNLRLVSTESLILKSCAILGGFDLPSWVAAEYDAPIPYDAPSWWVKKAESDAREIMRRTDDTGEPDSPPSEKMLKELNRSLAHLSKFVGQQFGSLDDVQQWCEGAGKDYKPCH